MNAIGILGAGAWGTALALSAARAGREVILCGRDAVAMAQMRASGENARHLPGIQFGPKIGPTSNIGDLMGADAILLAVPSQEIRVATLALAPHLKTTTPLVITAKGIERSSGLRLSQVLSETVPGASVAVLSGPSFAVDVARGLPTAVTIAAYDPALAADLARALASASLRPYAENDVVGVELGGALKNVLAIAAGVVAGRGLGASALAALVARGFAELRRFAEAFDARPETLMGLSGLGDLVLSCSSTQSRNFSHGFTLGTGRPSDPTHPLVEGVPTAAVARDLARERGVSMPLTEAVAQILAGEIGIDAAVERLMSRPLRREAD